MTNRESTITRNDDPFASSWVPWEAYGVTPMDVSGWSFLPGRTNDSTRAAHAISDFSLTVLAPVGFTVAAEGITVAGDASWGEKIRRQDAHLILRLPLIAREGSRVLVLPPQETAAPSIKLKTIVYTGGAGEIELVWEFSGAETFTVPEGLPIAHLIAISGAIVPETIENSRSWLRIWRLHPHGARVCPAEKTLRGDATTAATRWCGPFAHANAYGFWLFPPLDLDVVWHGGRSFEHRFESIYTDDDASVVSRLQSSKDKYRYVPRNKVEFGSTLESVLSLWTGCIFQTPPGWGLLIRDPININASTIFRAQEAVLETDWLPYDIWVNLLFLQQGKWAKLRRSENWPPIAQLLPVPRAAYDQRWRLIDGLLERTSAEGNDLYMRWNDYNYKKWTEKGQKEPSTYYRERHASLKT